MSIAEQHDDAEPIADAFAERVFASALGAVELFSVYVGDRLGWYRSLADEGPATYAELAARTSTDERYTQEWLEQQAVYGILETDPSVAADERRYGMNEAVTEVLTDETSQAYLAPISRAFAAVGKQLPALLDAYRSGGGVSWDDLGDDAREAQAAMNRPWFEQQLGGALSGVPEVHEILSRDDARILDVGAGGGWSSIALAKAYPNARVDGIDVDAPSVEMATQNAADAGLSDRVSFGLGDAGSLGDSAAYDAAFAFECVHDMPRPVEVLAAVRGAVKPDGAVIVMDEAVADEFTAPGDDVERLMYGFSVFVCLPDGMSSQPSVGTGTVMRRSTLERYADEAGYAGVDVLPIEDFAFFRFYRLR
ncbi:MAG TPA: class I SAM-dependent methyltransferase [Nocardioidaceae bacterium]